MTAVIDSWSRNAAAAAAEGSSSSVESSPEDAADNIGPRLRAAQAGDGEHSAAVRAAAAGPDDDDWMAWAGCYRPGAQADSPALWPFGGPGSCDGQRSVAGRDAWAGPADCDSNGGG